MNTVNTELEEFIEERLGGENSDDSVVVDPQGDDLFHPQAVTFYCENPNSSFSGFTTQPIFDTNLLLGDMDDDRKYRLERHGQFLLYTRYEASSGNGTHWATGQALVCEPGSDAESVFSVNAMADVAWAASEPLRCAMEAMRKSSLSLSHGFEGHLKSAVFGQPAA